jgi:hypothetical protein
MHYSPLVVVFHEVRGGGREQAEAAGVFTACTCIFACTISAIKESFIL